MAPEISRSSQPAEPTISSTSLIQRLQVRDELAWSRFVDLCSPLIWGWCRQSGLAPSDAADVSQEVFAAVARSIGRYHRSGSFRGWLWQVTRNKLVDHIRARKRAPASPGGSEFGNFLGQIPDTPPDEASLAVSNDSLVSRALELVRSVFDEATWTAFMKMTFEKKSAAEIAVELGWANGPGCALGAKRVRQAKYRVIKRLRDEFGDMLDLA